MSGNILLVEDDPAIATVITAALEDEGMLVHRCDSIAARDRLLAAQRFDAMLTDVILTDGDGIVSLPAVRAVDAEMPVIVLSAQTTLDTAVRASATTAFAYFPKTFAPAELERPDRIGRGKR